MSEPVDLNAERNKRAAPDAEFTRHDAFGRPMYCYATSYKMGDDDWSAEVWAYSDEEAAQKVEAMRSTLKLDGQMMRSRPWDGVI